jgi:hypothetical protein
VANSGAEGYYRTRYTSAALERLADANASLRPEERLTLIADTSALLRAGRGDVLLRHALECLRHGRIGTDRSHGTKSPQYSFHRVDYCPRKICSRDQQGATRTTMPESDGPLTRNRQDVEIS